MRCRKVAWMHSLSVDFMGTKMHPWTMKQTLAVIMDRIDKGVFTQHCVVNVAKVVNMLGDATLRNAVHNCDIVNVDGQGVVWGARLCGIPIPERVAGIDLFHELIKESALRGHPVFLLGAKEDIVQRTAEILTEEYPDLILAGYHHGYFWEDESRVVETIRASRAKLLFVAISSPKKEAFIDRWKSQLGVDFAMGVGGTFDVVAGKTKRAPVWMQKAGLEWLYRVIQEPGRLWQRYLKTNSRFALLLCRELVRRRLLKR